jgi:glycine cleavage system H protein
MTREGLKYTKEHEWARAEGDVVTVGITDYAQDQLSDVVYVELPAVGRKLGRMDAFGVIEAVKTVSDLYSPVAGEVIEVNGALGDDPGLINRSPYDDGWMVRIRASNVSELDGLLDAPAYSALVEETSR